MKFTPSQDPRIAINLKLSEVQRLKDLLFRIKPSELPKEMLDDLFSTIQMLDDAKSALTTPMTK